jgi:primosomal replication protein N
VLIGEVVRTPKQSTSPAGISHSQFSIDHKSIQNEAGMNRQAFVRIQVVATGDLSHFTRELVAGNVIKVTGFINRHESRNGNPLLALHAQQIEMIN